MVKIEFWIPKILVIMSVLKLTYESTFTDYCVQFRAFRDEHEGVYLEIKSCIKFMHDKYFILDEDEYFDWAVYYKINAKEAECQGEKLIVVSQEDDRKAINYADKKVMACGVVKTGQNKNYEFTYDDFDTITLSREEDINNWDILFRTFRDEHKKAYFDIASCIKYMHKRYNILDEVDHIDWDDYFTLVTKQAKCNDENLIVVSEDNHNNAIAFANKRWMIFVENYIKSDAKKV